MSKLRIEAGPELGLLSVKVISAKDHRQVAGDLMLSSTGRRQETADLAPGAYIVIATRPNEEVITKQVTVGDKEAAVRFGFEGQSPHEFLHDAAARGLVPALPQGAPHDQPGIFERFGSSTAGNTALVLGSLAAAAIAHPAGVRAGLAVVGALQFGLNALSRTSVPDSRSYFLCHWQLTKNGWLQSNDALSCEIRPNYVHVRCPIKFDPADLGKLPCRALGVLDESGFGPVVLVPAFRQGLRLTFIADGLRAAGAANRTLNPAAARVPVAIALPEEAPLADILSGLTAPGLAGADRLLDSWLGQSEMAIQYLMDKFEDPAAAILAAHFLSRYAPERAPVEWLRNLNKLVPYAADTALLLALRLIGSAEDRRAEIVELLQDAAQRQSCLFARTRGLLAQALRLHGRDLALEPSVISHHGDFLDFAADAGGPESFWGTGPDVPGCKPASFHQPSLVRFSLTPRGFR